MKLGIFDFNFKDGNWLWKADYNTLFKKNGVLRKKYHDLPAFKSIYGIEGAAKKEFEELVVRGVKEIAEKIK